MNNKKKVGEVKSLTELSAIEQLRLRYENKELTQSQVLITIAKLGVEEFFKSDHGIAATISVNNQKRTYLVEDELFKKWLVYQFYLTFNDSPTNKELTEALSTIKSFLEFERLHFKKIYYRIGEFEGKVYFDLANDDYEVVEISQDGFRVVNNPPVKFLRSESILALPHPSEIGDISILKSNFNLNDQYFKLWIAFLFGSLNPKGPYPLLVITGNAGTGKSFFSEITKNLLDPAISPVISAPKTEEDLLVTAQNNWLLAFDNLSGLPYSLSDAFCKLSTGIGLSRRKLFTNKGQSVLSAARPVILNGIDSITDRQDLADRSIVLNLSVMHTSKRKTEQDLLQLIDENLPQILGYFFNATVLALKNFNSTNIPNLPRMADFAKWVSSAETALGFEKGEFLKLYTQNINEAGKDLFETDVIAYGLVQALSKQKHLSGTAIEILTHLKTILPLEYTESVKWPAPNKLGRHIARIQPTLMMQGIQYDFKRTAKARVHIFKKL